MNSSRKIGSPSPQSFSKSSKLLKKRTSAFITELKKNENDNSLNVKDTNINQKNLTQVKSRKNISLTNIVLSNKKK